VLQHAAPVKAKIDVAAEVQKMHEANAQSLMADAVKDEDLAEMERTMDLKNKLEDPAFTRPRLERWPRQVPRASLKAAGERACEVEGID
jgi:hypothetical protein